ncbi:ester cyclase [Zobellia galactanivorans]|uniref:Conserved hypothetical membrane protein n=1 Tax=Zobellia galactanivorans (strain DSM 12802 / CCUG 47099 / CIP 106680 / NCIMB 13871 / Dsij) TaxID=63186 RepID=G0L1P7_ZOBGA|nr:ester cyclase [Zobellia galactanivorans]MBU3024312.1 ester cyclase [Zobellia galactanivorans]MDO6807419.1 ester cyclase [Zobellia galactanivorans]CAZ97801.1 Conserved hypothetical membrane protein [Zobellia galactanivorans]
MKPIGLLLTLLISIMASSCKDNGQLHSDGLPKLEHLMATNYNNFIEASWNKKNMDTLQSVSAENYIHNQNGIRVADNQNEMKAFMNIYFMGFPDAYMTVDATVIKGQQLFTHWTLTGTNTGIFSETPATGKKIKLSGHATVSFNNKGKIIQEDVYYNELELLQQLGYTLNPPVLK